MRNVEVLRAPTSGNVAELIVISKTMISEHLTNPDSIRNLIDLKKI